jgi:hypothetical protein
MGAVELLHRRCIGQLSCAGSQPAAGQPGKSIQLLRETEEKARQPKAKQASLYDNTIKNKNI